MACAVSVYGEQLVTRRVTIVGGGLAGAAAACGLGGRALLLERETGAHDKICGEFLSHEAGDTLAALGFDASRLGGAPIGRVRLHSGARTAAAALPFVAHGLSRRTLDEALLDHAAARGAEIRRGVSVRGLGDGTALTSEGETAAGTIFLASGKHDVRGTGRARDGTIDGLIGFKMFFRAPPSLAARLAGHVDVTLFEGGYAGLQPVEGGRVNLCLLVERARFKALGGTWDALFAALLREPSLAALEAAEALLARPLTISNVPYGYLAKPRDDGLWRLGDQAAVIPSFCGDGMAMALHSGHLAARMVADGADAPAFQARLRRDTARQVRLATTVQHVATTKAGRFVTMAGLSAVPGAMGVLARWTRVGG
ncbi:MAG: NAD(P)/FAD-dependent oxidoreductase [Polymorphobacter sp.]|uniref:NAD(P)/FAD-dependent oxidoreductase n=1 Tax=Polymorphobacter sp. TaxID=1909290 RepID=UPI003A865856